jgi:hypothetical protein
MNSVGSAILLLLRRPNIHDPQAPIKLAPEAPKPPSPITVNDKLCGHPLGHSIANRREESVCIVKFCVDSTPSGYVIRSLVVRDPNGVGDTVTSFLADEAQPLHRVYQALSEVDGDDSCVHG